MREMLGPLALTALYAFAGAGICAAAGAWVRERRFWVLEFGLWYMTGIAAVCLLLTLVLVAGIPYSLGSIAIAALAIGAGGFAAARRRGRSADRARHADADAAADRPRPAYADAADRLRPAWARADIAVAAAFALALVVYAALGLRTALVTPFEAWDGWAIWGRKAIVLANYGELRADVFASPAYALFHLDYPVLLPVLEANFFRAAGTIDTQAIHAQFWMLLVGFAWATAAIGARTARPAVWAPVSLLVLLIPGLTGHLMTGYADVPMGIFIGLGAVLLGGWLRDRARWQLVLATLMLAAGASVKNDGLMAAVVVLAAASAVVAVTRARDDAVPLAAAWGAFALAILPWRLWLAFNDISGDLPVARGLTPGYLDGRSDRVRPAFDRLVDQLQDQGQWMHVIPLALAVVLVALAFAAVRRVAAFYLVSGVLSFLVLVWVYWVNPEELGFLLNGSADRVVAAPVFLAIAALIQVPLSIDSRPPGDLSSPLREVQPVHLFPGR